MIFVIYKFAWKLISPTGISTLIDQVMKRHSYVERVVRDFELQSENKYACYLHPPQISPQAFFDQEETYKLEKIVAGSRDISQRLFAVYLSPNNSSVLWPPGPKIKMEFMTPNIVDHRQGTRGQILTVYKQGVKQFITNWQTSIFADIYLTRLAHQIKSPGGGGGGGL